jgi:hypothetical protein
LAGQKGSVFHRLDFYASKERGMVGCRRRKRAWLFLQ